MVILGTLLALLRRKAVLLPVLLAAVGLGAAGWVVAPVHYTSTAMIVLTSPVRSASPSGTGTTVTNPLLGFSESLKGAVSLVVQSVSAPDVADELNGGKNSATKVKVTNGRGSPLLLGADGPFVLIEADSARSGRAARDAVERATARVYEDLNSHERTLGAPESTNIVPLEVVQTTNPKASIASKTKMALGAAVVGFCLGLGCAYLVASVWSRRAGSSEQGPAEMPGKRWADERISPKPDPETALDGTKADIPAVLATSAARGVQAGER